MTSFINVDAARRSLTATMSGLGLLDPANRNAAAEMSAEQTRELVDATLRLTAAKRSMPAMLARRSHKSSRATLAAAADRFNARLEAALPAGDATMAKRQDLRALVDKANARLR